VRRGQRRVVFGESRVTIDESRPPQVSNGRGESV
jgi:hypothetical protein